MNTSKLLLALATVTVLPAHGADATAYKWVDADGITHYGQTAPPQYNATSIALDPAPAPAGGRDRHYESILQQAERLQQARLARERQRAEIEAAQRQADREAAQTEAALAAAEYYQQQSAPPTVIYRPAWRPHHPPHKPEHRDADRRRPPHHSGRDPAFDPPAAWLRGHPRLLRQELRAQRDYNPRRDR